MDQGTELENEDKQSCHSCMGHSILHCSIILLSTIKIFPMVAELHSRNKNEVKYGSGDIIRKRRLAELSFLHVTLCTDMFSRSNKYHYNTTIVELCSANQIEGQIWLKGHK